MRTIVITNQKGGCGKTTTAVNLAAALAEKGQRVLIVDLDPQAHATLGLGYEPDSLDRTIYHSLAHKQIPITKVILNTKIRGLDLVPSNVLLAKAEQELTSISRKEYILADQLKTVSSKYDRCIIDCPPSLGLLTFNALVACTDVIVPVQVHYYALEGLKQLLETVKMVRKRFYPCSVKIQGILLTFIEGKAALSQQVEQQMRQFFGNLVFETTIHNTIALAEAPSAGEPISAYAPESRGAADYRALADEVTDPEFKRKTRLPKEVSAMVDQVHKAPEAAALKPAPAVKTREIAKEKTKEEKKKKKTAGPVVRRGIGRKLLKASLIVLSVFALLLIIAAAALMAFMNMINNPPVARPDSVTVQEDTPTPIALRSSDPDQDELNFYVISGPSRGALSGAGPRMTYTPESNYSGPDKFTFIVNDGAMDSNSATVAITVVAVNDPPAAAGQSVTTKVDRSVPIVLSGSDTDSDTFKFAVAAEPEHGTLSFGSDFETRGKLIYTPSARFTGADSFTFKLHDGAADSVPATVSVNVTANHPPMADLQTMTTAEDTPSVVNLQGDDPDHGDTLTYGVVTGPSHGSLTGTAPNLTYAPNKNFSGRDSFTFKVNDGTTDSPLGTVSITVTPANDPPIATSDTITVLEDNPRAVALAAIDPDGDPLTYSVVKHPDHGSLGGTEPNLVYTPNPDFNGPDGFTFKASDGMAESMPASISVMVTPADDPPTANGANVTVKEDAASSVVLTGNDPDGDTLTFEVVRAPTHGRLSGKAPNLTYTPDPNFSWLDSFTFRVSDGNTESVPATILVSVTAVNDPPTAKDDKAMTEEDASVTVDVLLNDIEVDNELLTISGVTQGAGGSVAINPDGTLTYTPHPDFYGTDTFTYTVEDREAQTDDAKVTVVVGELNDAPMITSKPVATAMVDVLYSYSVEARDPDGRDILTYALAAQPAGMRINPMTGLIQWTPNETQKDTYEVVVKVADSHSVPASDTQTFRVRVNPTPPRKATLKVVGGYDQRTRKTLAADGKTSVVQDSDDKRLEINPGSYVCYNFSEVSMPPGATITSVVLHVEHFEEDQFAPGKLQWAIGTGWPGKPTTWISIDAPVRRGKRSESMDSWDITSFVDTLEKAKSVQLQIQNSDTTSRKKTSVDCIRAVVEWGWPPPEKPFKQRDPDLELVQYGPTSGS
ncbi:MAG: Ig-like domain-containing protein [Planctomycetota bacterium]|jgi:VCBS repeat-containing protein